MRRRKSLQTYRANIPPPMLLKYCRNYSGNATRAAFLLCSESVARPQSFFFAQNIEELSASKWSTDRLTSVLLSIFIPTHLRSASFTFSIEPDLIYGFVFLVHGFNTFLRTTYGFWTAVSDFLKLKHEGKRMLDVTMRIAFLCKKDSSVLHGICIIDNHANWNR